MKRKIVEIEKPLILNYEKIYIYERTGRYPDYWEKGIPYHMDKILELNYCRYPVYEEEDCRYRGHTYYWKDDGRLFTHIPTDKILYESLLKETPPRTTV